MSEPTPLSAEAESFVRKYKADGNAAMLQATSLIDAQATEIAALKEALEELRQVYHHVVHRGELDECELLLCQRARRVLAGKEAQCPKCEGRGFIRTMVDGERDSEPCSFCRMSGLAGKEAHDGN